MATSYPGSLDSLPRPTSTTAMNASGYEGDVVIDNISDAVEAIETELGTDPAGSFTTVKARLDAEDRYPHDRPALDSTYGDDFTESSLNARWTRVNVTSGNESYQQGDRASYLVSDWSGGTAFRAYTQSVPTGDFEAVLSVRSYAVYASPPIWGLAVLDSADAGYGVFSYNNPHLFAGSINAGGAYGSAGGTTLGSVNGAPASGFLGSPVWFRIRRVGSTYYFASSTDGEGWFTHHSGAVSSVTKIGPVRVFNAPTTHVLHLDRFNMMSI